MHRSRSLSRRSEAAVAALNRAASLQRRRSRSRSTPAEKARTARSLSAPGRHSCSDFRAAHILDKHFHSGADHTGSYFYSQGELERSVARALADPDAVQDTGRTRQLRFKTFQRDIGNSNGYFGGNKECDSVAVVVEKADGSVVTAYPLPSQHIPAHRASHQRMKAEDEPASILSYSDEGLHPDISFLSDPSQSHSTVRENGKAQPAPSETRSQMSE